MNNLKGKFITFKYRDRKEPISGFLIDFNDEWTLINYNPVDYVIDGYQILKSKNILKYKREEFEIFREKVLTVKGIKPTKKDIIPITNINETLKIVTEKFGAFKIELKDETVCYIGKLTGFNKNYIELQEIDNKAKWVENEKYKISSLRIIEFDSDYINSLILYNKTKK